jgi:hypothetical protein
MASARKMALSEWKQLHTDGWETLTRRALSRTKLSLNTPSSR